MTNAPAERPVVLVVEDDLLLRMDAVYIVRSAGFDVAEAGKADAAIIILEARPNIRRFHRYPDARIDGRPQAGEIRERPLAPHQDHSDVRPGQDKRRRLAAGRAFSAEALQPI